MQTAIYAQNSLIEAGFTLPLSHVLFTSASESIDPSFPGFVAVQTGGGCKALRCEVGDFYILITSADGSDVPDMQDWDSCIIGVYRESDDDEIACVTAIEWQDVILTPVGLVAAA